VALFCENVPILVTLRLPGVTVEADRAIFETWSCGDPSCATLSVTQQWSGTTTRARGIVRQLEGGTLRAAASSPSMRPRSPSSPSTRS
jgi:hypothetical protein